MSEYLSQIFTHKETLCKVSKEYDSVISFVEFYINRFGYENITIRVSKFNRRTLRIDTDITKKVITDIVLSRFK